MPSNIQTLLTPFSLFVIATTVMLVITLKSITSAIYCFSFVAAVLVFGASTSTANKVGAITCFLTAIVVIGKDFL